MNNMKTDIENWAENLQKDVYLKWKNDYSFWKQGFKVFYGPVKKSPELMIISHNPGGDHTDFEDRVRFERGNYSIPSSTPYSTNHIMSKKMQKFFEGHEHLLSTSVTFPVIFFRSKNVKTLNEIERFKKYEMERYSLLKVREIIDTLKPKNILVVGLSTYDILSKVIGLCDAEEFLHQTKSSRLLAIRSKLNKTKIFAMMHISGARINNQEMSFIKKEFFKYILS